MEVPSYFEKFLREIRPTPKQIEDYRCGHTTLRERLESDEDLKPIVVSTFLQGSYRRATAVRPRKDKRPDVDVIVVTRLNRNEYPPDEAMDLFVPFLDRYYEDKYRRQGRSFGVELSYVDLDLVITSAPSESEEEVYESKAVTTYETLEDAPDWRLVKSWVPLSERDSIVTAALMEATRKEAEWKTEPLWIPNRDAGKWERTHPLEQIKWTWGKNSRCNGHYVNVVKAIKWWRQVNCETLERPKGYPLEHLVGMCCPDSIQSVAEGVTLTLEAIVESYGYYAESQIVPYLGDHGVPEHDVFARVSGEDFAQFYDYVTSAAKIAREAWDADTTSASAEKWRELFGNKFPPGDDDNGNDRSDPRGPFIAPSPKSQTGDLTPRRWGRRV